MQIQIYFIQILTEKMITFNTSYSTSKVSPGINAGKYIVVHHTWLSAGTTDLTMVKYLASNPKQVSVHFVVGRDWQIYQLAPLNTITWHAWAWEYEWNKSMNAVSIGIEIVSDWHVYTEEQKKSVRNLIAYIMEKSNITDVKKIIRHADFASYRWKRDVGPNFYKEFWTWEAYQNSFKSKSPWDLIIELWILNGQEMDRPMTRREYAIATERVIKYLSQLK